MGGVLCPSELAAKLADLENRCHVFEDAEAESTIRIQVRFQDLHKVIVPTTQRNELATIK